MGEPNYFSRIFKKVEGIAPIEYRKKWKNISDR
jgi:YesN/AraC family two-component response regulator